MTAPESAKWQRAAERHPSASRRLPAGFYGNTRRRIAVFAATGALGLAAAIPPLPRTRLGELLAGVLVFLVLTTIALVVPWPRTPRWLWPVVPIGYIGVIAVVRDAQGGGRAAIAILYLLPVVWLALYGMRAHVVAGLVALALAIGVPILAAGPPAYPATQWRGLVVAVAVAALTSFTILATVDRNRAYALRISERSRAARRSEAAALDSREQLEAVLAAATSTAVIGADDRGMVTFFSGGAEQTLGYHRHEVVGRRSVVDFGDPDELLARREELGALIASASHGRPLTPSSAESVWTFVRKDGARRRATVVLTARRQRDQLVGYVLVATDVTEREQLAAGRARLAAADAEVTEVLAAQNRRLRELTQMKDEVVATVSHELRTPLTSIRGFVELLLHDGRERYDSDTLRMLRTIDRNSRQLLRVADDLLADPSGGRGLRLHFVDTDLAALAADAVDSALADATRRRIHLSWLAEAAVPVHGDPARLHQLLANLLTNALKFGAPGGRVEVRVYATEQLAHLDVLDDGPGISQVDRSHLFERFYRLDHPAIRGVPGTGLGLSIVKSVVDAHEGVVEIVDTPGWSTTFRVLLPLAPAEGSPAPLAELPARRSPTPEGTSA